MGQLGWFWTKEDTELVMRLHSERVPYAEIGLKLNRTANSVKNHIARLKVGPDRVAEYRRKGELNRRMKKNEENAFDPKRENDVVFRPTTAMLEDRFKRELLPPRDLTGILMGDPPVGLSALERRT